MLALLSPAKNLDYQSNFPDVGVTTPRLLEDSLELVDTLKTLSPEAIGKLMKLSDKLSDLNYERYAKWSLPLKAPEAKPSVFAFNGDVYGGLDASTLTKDALRASERQLRILSGLYGLMRPFDLMLPYRLEMGTQLKTERGKDLYQFWGQKITQMINADIEESGASYVVNLASNEYAKAVQLNDLSAPVITPVFKDEKNGQYKIISFYAKKARGMMARFICETQARTPEDLMAFEMGGYRYSPESSSGEQLVFLRKAVI